MNKVITVSGQYVDIMGKRIYPATLTISNGTIESIIPCSNAPMHYIMPGFIDSHVHIESSMLIPSSFARLAVVHGTIGTISDPHEIANVCGVNGVHYMIENGKKVPFHFFFGAPSCVPATIFETAGAVIDSDQVSTLLAHKDIYFLSEVMNFPEVLHKEEEVMKKIRAAHMAGKPVDGHAPGIRGGAAKQYIQSGISTDHECFTIEEALDKLSWGMKILIREGSAAKNFEALYELLDDHPHMTMLCSDDKHPDSLLAGHINTLCARAVANGIDIFNVLRAACINPILHYKLPIGEARAGDPANFIIVEDLISFQVKQTYIDGTLVAENGQSYIPVIKERLLNHFEATFINEHALQLQPTQFPRNEKGEIPVMVAIDGQLITPIQWISPTIQNNLLVSNSLVDILKIVVYNRYKKSPPKIAFVKNFGIKKGAIASTVAHDSHNIIAVGLEDYSITKAINLLIAQKGGISCVNEKKEKVLGLPVAGLMSIDDPYIVAKEYTDIDVMAKELGSQLSAPFMTLSFMALLVIPHLKLSDKGLFDGDQFKLF
jgi:adenine deaminase